MHKIDWLNLHFNLINLYLTSFIILQIKQRYDHLCYHLFFHLHQFHAYFFQQWHLISFMFIVKLFTGWTLSLCWSVSLFVINFCIVSLFIIYFCLFFLNQIIFVLIIKLIIYTFLHHNWECFVWSLVYYPILQTLVSFF